MDGILNLAEYDEKYVRMPNATLIELDCGNFVHCQIILLRTVFKNKPSEEEKWTD